MKEVWVFCIEWTQESYFTIVLDGHRVSRTLIVEQILLYLIVCFREFTGTSHIIPLATVARKHFYIIFTDNLLPTSVVKTFM